MSGDVLITQDILAGDFLTIFVSSALVLVFGGFFFLFRNSSSNQNTNGVPQQPIHWHPKLKIIINGEEQLIPVGIGINIGKSMDYEISGMRMSPTHTHESDGTIHLENNRPWQKPETLTFKLFSRYLWAKPVMTIKSSGIPCPVFALVGIIARFFV